METDPLFGKEQQVVIWESAKLILIIDKVLIFTVGVYEEGSCVSMEY